MSRHNCDALGACQQRTPACLGCEHHALAASVQASRDTGCCHIDVPDPAMSKAERIAYWASVGIMVGASVGVVFGSAGYLVARFAS